MNTTKPTQNQPFHQPKPPAISHVTKSPFEAGGNKGDGIGTNSKPLSIGEHLDGVLNFVADSLFGSSGQSSSSPDQDKSTSNSTNPFAEALKKQQESNTDKDKELKKQKHLMKHQEMQMTEIFDLEKKKSEEMIKHIKQELNLLINEIKKLDGNVNKSTETAVFMDEVNPGVGHVNFFTKLRNFLVLLRRRVSEGNNWMNMFQSKKGKSLYERNSSKYGSQYMFGQEGQGLTRQNG